MGTIKLEERLCSRQQCISWGAMQVQARCAAAGAQDLCLSRGQAAGGVAGGQLYGFQAHMQTMVQHTALYLRHQKATAAVAVDVKVEQPGKQ